MATRTNFFLLAFFSLGVVSCSPTSAKKEYVLAEKLWTDGNYAAAVTEFEKVYALEPRGKLGLQALFRAATTQAFFLSEYSDAIQKFKAFAEASATTDREAAWEARLQIGEILFSKLELYDQAAQLYQDLLKRKPKDPDAPLFQFRVAKSEFFQWQFDRATEDYRKLIDAYPESGWAERAAYEIGVTEYTHGEQGTDHGMKALNAMKTGGAKGASSYQIAIQTYQDFLKKYPKSPWAPQAQFGIAACLEEMDQIDAAYRAYEALKETYPSRNVIRVKLIRLRERKAQRSH